MKTILPSVSRDELLEKASLRINQAVYRVSVGLTLVEDEPLVEEDLSNVTVQEILDKIKDFLNSDPLDEHYIIFVHYLAKYPVSMCKRQVSPVLKLLIGFHYRLGQILKEEYEKVSPVSIVELAQIFGRSKATIHEYIKQTEPLWKEFQDFLEKQKEAEELARRELVEEAKERLRKEKPNDGEV